MRIKVTYTKEVTPSSVQAAKVLRSMPTPGFLFTISDEPTGRPAWKPKDRPLSWNDVKPVVRSDAPGAVALAKLPMRHLNG